ncbi:MAG: hypothetical protein A3K76_03580 [Euryarchaeota archaeon RBG_13_57_23]|nr:MAG: hypothetical protein A3K76_03580 [Euryarchaeota archaeon RBG_13_57_23]
MNDSKTGHRPAALKVLVALEGVFAIVGFMSGYGLLSSPSGEGLGLSIDLLDNAPVSDYTLVGLFFVAFYGILPSMTAYGLWTRRRWRWTDAVNKWTGQLWGWTATAALGIIMLLWIVVELIFVGALSGIGGALQIVITVLGVVVLGLVTRPSVRSHMRLED